MAGTNPQMLRSASRFEEKPAPALRLIDPVLEKAGCSHIAGIVTESMDGAHSQSERLVVLMQLAQHVGRGDEVGVVVRNSLQTCDVPDGSDCGSADLTDTLSDIVRNCEDLIGMVVKQEMVVAKVRATHVPMEVFGFQIEAEDICKEGIECSQ